MSDLRQGFVIFINTLCEGPTPVVSDDNGYIIFDTEVEAQLEIADGIQMKLQQFIESKGMEGDFHDLIKVEEYIRAVTVLRDGRLMTDDGRCYAPRPE